MDVSYVEGKHLEKVCRLQLEAASVRYLAATMAYRRIIEEHNAEEGAESEETDDLARARQAESEASVEYGRVLRRLSDVAVYGKLPEQKPPAGSGGE